MIARRVLALGVALAAGCGARPSAPTASETAAVVDPDEIPVSQVVSEPGALPVVVGIPAGDRPRLEIAPGPLDAEVKTTARVLDGPILGRDPQLAVGERFAIVFEDRRYQIVDKATGRLSPARAGDEIASSGDFTAFFSPLWSGRDKRGRANLESVNARLVPGGCDPARPEASPACLRDVVEPRIVWDAKRRRFWIAATLENRLGLCREGCEQESSPGGIRLVALAVSRTDDPRDGFHRYALVREGDRADGPKIAVNDHYLIVGHRRLSAVHVFDADRLAAGNPGRGPARVARIDVGQYGLRFFDPVNQHGESGGVTYLLGTDGSDRVKLLALVNRDPERAAPPDVVPGRWIGISRRIEAIDSNAVWRGGFLGATWDECAAPTGAGCDGPHQIHVLRLPAMLDGPGASVEVKRLRAAGFLDFAFGGREPSDGAQDRVDYRRPAIDVNRNGDAVIVYARRGVETAQELDPEVRYAILYHGEPRPRAGVLVRRGGWFELPEIGGGPDEQRRSAGIDLAAAAVDPSDDRSIWVSHAYADKDARWYRQVVAVVQP